MTEEYIEYIANICTGSVVVLTVFIVLSLVALMCGVMAGTNMEYDRVIMQKWVPKYIAIMLTVIFILCIFWIFIPFSDSIDKNDGYLEVRGFINTWLVD